MKVAKKAASAPVSSASAADRFRAASAAARDRNTRASFRAFDRGVAQAKAAGYGFMGTVTSKRDVTASRRRVSPIPKATGFDFSANRTPRQQRSIDRTNAATRFYGLGTVGRGAKRGEFGPKRGRAGYRAPSTRIF
jgi:hypothetical protein